MRKLLIAALAATTLIPAGAASAQTYREVRQDQREVRRDVARGDYREARRDRQELREDWRDYQRAHRNEYRRNAWVGPRGYRYRPVAVGTVLNRLLYGDRYYVSDWNRYRLPNPGRFQRYVRYGDDVLLVNVRNGRVIRVYNNFYWR
jgi:Ni/Co efflux regulator RcnB